MTARRWVQLLAALVTTLALAACTSGAGGKPQPGNPSYHADARTLNIVAGSEQKEVFDKVIDPWCKQHGYTCTFAKKGSVDQARLLATGNTDYDAYWFASDVFRRLGDPQGNKLQDVQFMFTTPVVFAGWKSEMQKLGFVGRNVSTAEVYDAVVSGKTHTWATNPTQSNSGATAYLGFLSYLAGNGPGKVLTAGQLRSARVRDGIMRFVHAIGQTPASTDDLMNDCIARPGECRSVFTYEALVIQHNKELVAKGREPLYAVYPQGSLEIADAPLGFLPHNDGATAGKRQVFKELQGYLLSSEGQQKVLALGRRPASSIGLSLDHPNTSVFNPDWGIRANLREQTVRFPAAPVIREALDSYQLKFRSPADTVYCLDGSGSMQDNGGWDAMTQGHGTNPPVTHVLFDPAGQAEYFLQTSPRDRTTVLLFSDVIKGQWTVDGNNPAQLKGLENNILAQGPGGGTAIYDCLGHAAQVLSTSPDTNRKRLVILMTDGHNGDGGTSGLDQIAALHVPVITVAYGDGADTGTLQQIADRTGGRFVNNPKDLVGALREATSYR